MFGGSHVTGSVSHHRRLEIGLQVFTVLCAMGTGVVWLPSSVAAPQEKQAAKADAETIDFNKARELFQKQQRGEKLTPDEQAYIQKAVAARRAATGNPQNRPQPGPPGGSLTPRESIGVTPLSEMTARDRYKGEDGGLYGGGLNTPPEAHERAARAELARIKPLNADGQPAGNGRIVFLSLSMSNATQEFSRFKRIADADAEKSSQLTIVDGAQGGQAMAEWAPPDARPWSVADQRLTAEGVSPKQVQIAWIKLANKGPRGDLQEHGRQLQKDTQAVIQNAKSRYPNLRIVYLSSRIYGGYTTGMLNPEPYAFESAFAARWLIQDQIKGSAELNFDQSKGTVKAPLLLWGPYLWADGMSPRKSDHLVYTREDLAQDGTHPSELGRDKVARLMLQFYKSDPLSKAWFVGKEK